MTRVLATCACPQLAYPRHFAGGEEAGLDAAALPLSQGTCCEKATASASLPTRGCLQVWSSIQPLSILTTGGQDVSSLTDTVAMLAACACACLHQLAVLLTHVCTDSGATCNTVWLTS